MASASMEPRFGDRGTRRARRSSASSAKPLQWSRGSVTAERRAQHRPLRHERVLLQWSRGSVTAERCSDDRGDRVVATGFNGAAVR